MLIRCKLMCDYQNLITILLDAINYANNIELRYSNNIDIQIYAIKLV